jgi:actin-like ATPase involved in cell morphogenesis
MPLTPFLIGVDLGTTNIAVAAIDTRRRQPRVEVFKIPQVIAPGVVEARPVLPSFLYFPELDEIATGGFALPFSSAPDGAVAGVLARDRGALSPARQVSSAKSWLAHRGVDRHTPFLPWESAGATPSMSPVQASARFLIHVRDAWNATLAASDGPSRFEQQSIVLTVPASFDEDARELTIEAAQSAGLSNLTLLEEPIAAFYAWMAERRKDVALEDDQVALVCDVGGGTTDFSLIRVRVRRGVPAFERIAIGDHLLLGGDNLDIALAAIVEHKLADAYSAARLAITQRLSLRRQCSAAKELIFGETAANRVPITVLGAGRSLVGGAMTVDLSRDEVQTALDEFLPIAPAEERRGGTRRVGLRELGLPYESDPAITRHLAAFLIHAAPVLAGDHRAVVSVAGRPMIRPDLVLFNGGFFVPPVARERMTQTLAGWFGDTPGVLVSTHAEVAVAVGAATYARLRAGAGRRGALIKAGSGRAYYVGLRAPAAGEGREAVCVLARGTDEGTEQTLDHPFTVDTNRPVSFPLYSSTTRPDRVGDIVRLTPEVDAREHPPLVTVFRFGKKSRHVELPVRLSVAFTAVGTLEIWCGSETTEHRWRLQFQVRSEEEKPDSESAAVESDATGIAIAEEVVAAAESLIRALFEQTSADVTPENIVALLEQRFGYAKIAWPLGVIRRLADVLLEVSDSRRHSPPFESRWLNLFGFCVRPGFGAVKDPWRISEARKIFVAGVTFPNAIQNRVEWLVLWQRAAGGFSAGQQRDLAQRVMPDVGLTGAKPKKPNPQIARESWRVLASLERLDAAMRTKIGNELIARLQREPANPSLLWSIARIGARTPIYGALTSVVSAADASRWLEVLLDNPHDTPELFASIVQIAALTGDPLREVGEHLLDRARRRLEAVGVDAESRPLYEVMTPTLADTSRAFGEPLPNGLKLVDPLPGRGDSAPGPSPSRIPF